MRNECSKYILNVDLIRMVMNEFCPGVRLSLYIIHNNSIPVATVGTESDPSDICIKLYKVVE